MLYPLIFAAAAGGIWWKFIRTAPGAPGSEKIPRVGVPGAFHPVLDGKLPMVKRWNLTDGAGTEDTQVLDPSLASKDPAKAASLSRDAAARVDARNRAEAGALQAARNAAAQHSALLASSQKLRSAVGSAETAMKTMEQAYQLQKAAIERDIAGSGQALASGDATIASARSALERSRAALTEAQRELESKHSALLQYARSAQSFAALALKHFQSSVQFAAESLIAEGKAEEALAMVQTGVSDQNDQYTAAAQQVAMLVERVSGATSGAGRILPLLDKALDEARKLSQRSSVVVTCRTNSASRANCETLVRGYGRINTRGHADSESFIYHAEELGRLRLQISTELNATPVINQTIGEAAASAQANNAGISREDRGMAGLGRVMGPRARGGNMAVRAGWANPGVSRGMETSPIDPNESSIRVSLGGLGDARQDADDSFATPQFRGIDPSAMLLTPPMGGVHISGLGEPIMVIESILSAAGSLSGLGMHNCNCGGASAGRCSCHGER